MEAFQRWCRIAVVRRDGTVVRECVLEGQGAPDLQAVDDVARIALAATRAGCHARLVETSAELRELVDLCGLPVDVERETELREQALGVEEGQEELHPGDLSA